MKEISFVALKKYMLLFKNEEVQRNTDVKIPIDNILNYGFS